MRVLKVITKCFIVFLFIGTAHAVECPGTGTIVSTTDFIKQDALAETLEMKDVTIGCPTTIKVGNPIYTLTVSRRVPVCKAGSTISFQADVQPEIIITNTNTLTCEPIISTSAP